MQVKNFMPIQGLLQVKIIEKILWTSVTQEIYTWVISKESTRAMFLNFLFSHYCPLRSLLSYACTHPHNQEMLTSHIHCISVYVQLLGFFATLYAIIYLRNFHPSPKKQLLLSWMYWRTNYSLTRRYWKILEKYWWSIYFIVELEWK